MQIVVIADGAKQTEFQDKQIQAGVQVYFVSTMAEAKKEADAYFYLLEEEDLQKDMEQIREIEAPVFVNAVSVTLKDLPANSIRICAWSGFLMQHTIEICTAPQNAEKAEVVLKALDWNFQKVPDIVGMIAPRTSAILINEAYLLLDTAANEKQEIDAAIKLATNYTYGPFELAEKIGIKKIYTLLIHLSAIDMRYNPAPSLKNDISDLGITT